MCPRHVRSELRRARRHRRNQPSGIFERPRPQHELPFIIRIHDAPGGLRSIHREPTRDFDLIAPFVSTHDPDTTTRCSPEKSIGNYRFQGCVTETSAPLGPSRRERSPSATHPGVPTAPANALYRSIQITSEEDSAVHSERKIPILENGAAGVQLAER